MTGRPAAAYTGRGQALLLVGHGSTDPRHAASLHRLAEELRGGAAGGGRSEPAPRVALGFLDHCGPTVAEALADLLAPDGGSGDAPTLTAWRARRAPVDVRVLPLFLTTAYHVRHDVPAALRTAVEALPAADRRRVTIGLDAALGPDPLLRAALAERLRDAGVEPDGRTGVLLGAAGTSDRDALAGIAAEARAWRAAGRLDVLPGYASTAAPDAARAVAALRRRGAERVAVASYFLAPGLLHDRLAEAARGAGATVVAEPLCTPAGVTPALARLVLGRLDQARCRPVSA